MLYTVALVSAVQHHESAINIYIFIYISPPSQTSLPPHNLEPVIQRKASQKEKNKYHILMHINGI